jgi:dTDP-4-dehydrorhamnose 3,5-epimerase
MNTELFVGGNSKDLRGKLRFCNDFDMSAVKRFYAISNSAEQPVRGWIGHKNETKWFFPLRGVTVIEVETMDFVAKDAENAKGLVELAADRPAVLKVPPGNWFKIVQYGDAEVMVFSDCRVGEYKDDDFRRPI